MDNGSIYVGKFINGQMNGEGTLIGKDGSIYQGTFKDNKRDGEGIYAKGNNCYIGPWIEGKQDGIG